MPATPKQLSHGEMLTAILLALCPTGIGLALKGNIPTSPGEWANLVPGYDADPAATAQMQRILTDPRYSDLFTSLLTERDAALVIQEKIKNFFQGAIPPPGDPASSAWGDNPPHPSGPEVVSLISYLAKLQ